MDLASSQTPRGVVSVCRNHHFRPIRAHPERSGVAQQEVSTRFEMARQPKVELYERISLRVDLCALERHGA